MTIRCRHSTNWSAKELPDVSSGDQCDDRTARPAVQQVSPTSVQRSAPLALHDATSVRSVRARMTRRPKRIRLT